MFNNKNQKFTEEELSNSSNIIGKGTTVEGNIDTFGNIRVEGRIIGNIKSKTPIRHLDSHIMHSDLCRKDHKRSGA